MTKSKYNLANITISILVDFDKKIVIFDFDFKIVTALQNRLSLFTEFYTHHTRFLFVPNPNVVSYRPQIACRTSVVGLRFGAPKNFGMAPPMVFLQYLKMLSDCSLVSFVIFLLYQLSAV